MIGDMKKLEAAYQHQIDVFFNISLKNRYLYVQSPKVASTTMKKTLNRLEAQGSKIDPDTLPLHPTPRESIHIKPFQLPAEMFADIVYGSEFFKFCFVRNPFDRLLSAYLDKIVSKKNEARSVYKTLGLSIESDMMTFEQFVGFLYERRDKSVNWNPHWPLASVAEDPAAGPDPV
ncbi:sulfotransferase family 2 domain-containing protein [Roseisalinus antarcticus]|uniref:Sulfotransferase family protein n=1 Tax=Roseisalinus antarcticus TaxID=254357 RepID=A0A1Y5TV83_9RHOB|nr:sulfotransferase family 2 domain-containing protein [Roseisalinus antarcticus]SLN69145.1 Sulfotransferase family protein [Roseisalinus antarcticus]